MSNQFGYSKTTTAGLIIYLDAANTTSYVSGSSLWRNLCGASKSGSIGAGLTYNSSNGGSIVFPGTPTDVVLFGPANASVFPMPVFSFEMWFKSPGLAPSMTLGGLVACTYGIRLYIQSDGSILFGVYDTVSGLQRNVTTTGINYFDNSWHHVVASNDGIKSYLYADGVLKTTGSANWTGQTAWPTDPFRLGRDNNDAYYYLTGSIAIFKTYNTVLSGSQVLLNYNTHKSRFGY